MEANQAIMNLSKSIEGVAALLLQHGGAIDTNRLEAQATMEKLAERVKGLEFKTSEDQEGGAFFSHSPFAKMRRDVDMLIGQKDELRGAVLKLEKWKALDGPLDELADKLAWLEREVSLKTHGAFQTPLQKLRGTVTALENTVAEQTEWFKTHSDRGNAIAASIRTLEAQIAGKGKGANVESWASSIEESIDGVDKSLAKLKSETDETLLKQRDAINTQHKAFGEAVDRMDTRLNSLASQTNHRFDNLEKAVAELLEKAGCKGVRWISERKVPDMPNPPSPPPPKVKSYSFDKDDEPRAELAKLLDEMFKEHIIHMDARDNLKARLVLMGQQDCAFVACVLWEAQHNIKLLRERQG